MAANFKMDEKKFERIKKLLEAKWTRKDISETVGVNVWSITIVNQSKDLEEYKENISRRSSEKKARKEGSKEEPKEESKKPELIAEDVQMPGGKLSGSYITNRIITLLEKNNELLELLSNKLSFIVEQLS